MTSVLGVGSLSKMTSNLAQPIAYALPLGEESVPLNGFLGQPVQLRYLGQIFCTHCGRKTNKSFNQGYCYPCFKSLAQCDLCIMSPEKCHYHQGTCREPGWGETFCMTEHIVYLANSSAPKVGITRASQVPTRWIDQGAVAALPIMAVGTRQQSGFVEDCLRQHIADKTNWRNMLKGVTEEVDLVALAEELLDKTGAEITQLQQRFGIQAIQRLASAQVQELVYPVLEYPTKVKTHNFDKTPLVEGTLLGIKGQYWILDTGVINIRKFTAYQVELSA